MTVSASLFFVHLQHSSDCSIVKECFQIQEWRAFINVASCLNCSDLENKLNAEVCLGKCTTFFNFLSVKTELCKFFQFFYLRVCLPCICEHDYALSHS